MTTDYPWPPSLSHGTHLKGQLYLLSPYEHPIPFDVAQADLLARLDPRVPLHAVLSTSFESVAANATIYRWSWDCTVADFVPVVPS